MYQSGFYFPRLTKVNKIIIITLATVFIVKQLLSLTIGMNAISFNGLIGLSGQMVFNGYIYQLITYPFVEHGLLGVILESLFIWLVGSELEEIWGSKRYLQFFLVCVLGGGILFFLSSSLIFGGVPILSGMGGFGLFLLLAYAVLFPNREFFFGIKAKYVCLIFMAIQFVQYLGSLRGLAEFAGHLMAMGSGYLYMVLLSNPKFKQYFSSKKNNLGGGRRAAASARKTGAKRSKAKLRLVSDDEDDPEGKDSDGKPPRYWQ